MFAPNVFIYMLSPSIWATLSESGGRRCPNQNGKLLYAAFYLRSSPSYCSRTSCMWWRTRCQQIISNSFFLSLGRQRGGKKLSGLLHQCVRGCEGALWGSLKGFAAARVVVQGSHLGVTSWPVRGNSHCSFVGTEESVVAGCLEAGSWVMAAAGGCLGSRDHHPAPPQSIPACPAGLHMGSSGCLSTVEEASPPAIKFFFIPSIFQFWSSIYIHTHFSLAAAAFVPGEPFWRMSLTEMCFLIPWSWKP